MENKGLYINDLPPSGDVTFLAVVIEKELRSKRNGGSFLSVRLPIQKNAASKSARSQRLFIETRLFMRPFWMNAAYRP